MVDRIIPAKQVETEIRVSNSRFISNAAPVFSVEEAKQFIAQIKEKYGDANHNVPVFIIGHGASITAHSSDDGEPSGTAGRPALSVLQGSGFGDIVVVITRYFGGTKLGTGGLVRAYSDSMRAVLEKMPKAEKVSTQTVKIIIPYNLFEQIKLLIQAEKGKINREEFAGEINMEIEFRDENLEQFKSYLLELSNGKILTETIGTNPNTIMELD
ncbi:MAG: YigZ family protein [Chloroflexi bacterium]|jgi:uncharacterized YigZ family protein|nr:YigZ family protein [Chloroflexota bacterium]MBT3669918.1 YigZ family protein [Chloroflexota bacterium]MBT4001804.1 YigZ family protein [Chloroflexota bacterium]MBT4304820.1 YigZ family protein [Chloroflexota bacterium]MBT4534679.1 YigZ family protein [Chloroflexota bacterium]